MTAQSKEMMQPCPLDLHAISLVAPPSPDADDGAIKRDDATLPTRPACHLFSRAVRLRTQGIRDCLCPVVPLPLRRRHCLCLKCLRLRREACRSPRPVLNPIRWSNHPFDSTRQTPLPTATRRSCRLDRPAHSERRLVSPHRPGSYGRRRRRCATPPPCLSLIPSTAVGPPVPFVGPHRLLSPPFQRSRMRERAAAESPVARSRKVPHCPRGKHGLLSNMMALITSSCG